MIDQIPFNKDLFSHPSLGEGGDITMPAETETTVAASRRISPLGQLVRVTILVIVVAAVMVYAYVPAREFQRRIDCCENLKAYYAGKAPLDALRCPRSGGGYRLYPLPEGVVDAPFVHIVAIEPLDNHGGDGGAVLYSDGHAEFLMKGSYLARLESERARLEALANSSNAPGGAASHEP